MYKPRTVRFYKGKEIPWEVHDCDDTENCSFCKQLKRKFVKNNKKRKREELWNADPNCNHNIVCASGGGIKCTKCNGWYCY